MALAPYVNVDTAAENGVAGPNIVFKGANIHIISGLGQTQDGGSGLGNLIIGYDEFSGTLNPGDRGGSHNLIVGIYHKFLNTASAGVVLGFENTIGGDFNTVLGGQTNEVNNTAFSTIVGGESNIIGSNAPDSAILGGIDNAIDGGWGSIIGGSNNTCGNGSDYAVVVGGSGNTANGTECVVLGGGGGNGWQGNVATGLESVILGGHNQTATNSFSIAPQSLSQYP
jgi:hypothetical protein